jgi:mRNA-degrading endonuclease RelE of RelBE toxin-antitoxin system
VFTPKAYPKFNRIKKKLPERLRFEVDQQICVICENPGIGEAKTGDLQGVRVQKFTYLSQEYLIAYALDEENREIWLLAFGGHENFYRDLKSYLRS